MTGATLDLLLVLVILAYAFVGLRRGFGRTLLLTAGFVAGAALVVWFVVPRIDAVVPVAWLRPLAVIVLMLLAGGLGQALAMRLTARSLRSRAHGLDALLGGLVTATFAAALCWFGAGLVRGVAPTPVAKAITESRVLHTIDKVAPASSERVLARVISALDDYGFPIVFGGLEPEPITPVRAADQGVANSAPVRAARESVVRVDAISMSCGDRLSEGSGWVVDDGLVVTNAHVVAGAEQVRVLVGSTRKPGRVVAFDPDRDLAVLAVSDLGVRPLPRGGELAHGDTGAVLGFPLAGPYRVEAASVRGVIKATGNNIYGTSSAVREIYSLRASISPGNSGGPLLDSEGRVVGTVFARSVDDPTTAYALTLSEINPVVDPVDASSRAVGTGACAKG